LLQQLYAHLTLDAAFKPLLLQRMVGAGQTGLLIDPIHRFLIGVLALQKPLQQLHQTIELTGCRRTPTLILL